MHFFINRSQKQAAASHYQEMCHTKAGGSELEDEKLQVWLY
jgi:hypothetical protein